MLWEFHPVLAEAEVSERAVYTGIGIVIMAILGGIGTLVLRLTKGKNEREKTAITHYRRLVATLEARIEVLQTRDDERERYVGETEDRMREVLITNERLKFQLAICISALQTANVPVPNPAELKIGEPSPLREAVK